jgi:hypothetical protein
MTVALTMTLALTVTSSRSYSMRVSVDGMIAGISSLPYVMMVPNGDFGETGDHAVSSSGVLMKPFTHEL